MFEEGNKILIMFFDGNIIEISTTTHSIEKLRPKNLRSALFLAFMGSLRHQLINLNALYTDRKYFSGLKNQLFL